MEGKVRELSCPPGQASGFARLNARNTYSEPLLLEIITVATGLGMMTLSTLAVWLYLNSDLMVRRRDMCLKASGCAVLTDSMA